MSEIATYPSLAGRTVLVSGGASGIGAQIVRRFAGQNCKVGFLDVDEDAGSALADSLSATGEVKFVACDVTDTDALRAAIDEVRTAFGPIGVLVNNAAHDDRHEIADVTPEYWDGRMAVNLRHQFFAAQAVVDDMRALGGGVMIQMGSISWHNGQHDMVAYTTAKAGVEGLNRSLAGAFGPDNIRCVCIIPGWIMTERQREKWLDEEGEKAIFREQCLKRYLEPDDIARPILFAASDEAGALTNQTVIVDGGWR